MRNEINKIFNIHTIKVENVPEDLNISNLLDLIKDCELESIVKETDVIYLNFFEYFVFYQAYTELTKGNTMYPELIISYIESASFSPGKLLSYQAGASRSIYFSNINDEMDKEYFENICKPFGDIESLLVSKEKNHAQIRFYQFESAMKCMESLHKNEGKNKRYGFHRMKSHNKTFHTNRTLYLGNIQSEILPSDIVELCKGGALFSVRFLREKKCAFVTFVNPHAAEAFLYNCSINPLMIKKQRIKVTHGSNSNIPTNMILALYSGVTRSIEVVDKNINLGLEQLESFTRENDSVVYNFVSLYSAIKAMEGLKDLYDANQVKYVPDQCGKLSSAEMMIHVLYNELSKNN